MKFYLKTLLPALLAIHCSGYAQTLASKNQLFGVGNNSFSIEFVDVKNSYSLPDTIGNPERFIGYLNYGYRIGKYEISRDQISKASAQSGVSFNQADMSTYSGNGPDKPCTGLSWVDAAQFVNVLNTLHGYPAAYKINTAGGFELWQSSDSGFNSANPYRNSKARYVLPSEDEWYKAAYFDTNGVTTITYNNMQYSSPGSWWNFPNISDLAPQSSAGGSVGAVYDQFGPSDVQDCGELSFSGTMGQGGNVWEWMETGYDLVNDDPQKNRIIRGGSFKSQNSQDMSNVIAYDVNPLNSVNDLGFRVVDLVPRTGSYGDFNYEINTDLTECSIVSYNGFGGQVTIPSFILGVPVRTIANRCFSGNTAITSVIIPDGITTIGSYAFSGCSNLVSVQLPETLISIENCGFGYCRKLTTINIPSSVTFIGSEAFAATAIYSITIPNGITTITHNMLQECPNLSSVILPSSITTIEFGAFQVCTSLKTINLPPNLSSIGNYAFNMSGLTSITIPSSVTSFGWLCFAACQSLKEIIFYGSPPSFSWGLFQDITSNLQPRIFYDPSQVGWSSTYAGKTTYPIGTKTLSIAYLNSCGTVTVSPDQTYYSQGDVVSLQAQPEPGFVFISWTGDLISLNPSETLIMDGDKVINANFQQDINDTDGDGLSNYEEIKVYFSDPFNIDSNGDSVPDGVMVNLGYSPLLNCAPLINYLLSNMLNNGTPLYNQILNEGINEVISAPNNYNLYTTSQIHNLGLGGIVLDRSSNGELILHYEILQSTDLQNWTPLQSYDLPITNAPSDKMFLRVQAVGQ